jgi:homoserine O-acetyltransferase/O-succinyltransferase
MGGMATLEWPLCTAYGYVKNIVPIATSAYHGAWGISFGEVQRQAICTDDTFKNGWYDPKPECQPQRGLGTARMIAMLTYRSHSSFEARFSRKPAGKKIEATLPTSLPTPPSSQRSSVLGEHAELTSPPVIFSAQSYLQYQAKKFLRRFDANCYIHLTKKMDTHDVTRDRLASPPAYPPTEDNLREAFTAAPPKALVIGVETDVLFRSEQQVELAKSLPDATYIALDSDDGHDGFLLEFEALNGIILRYLQERCPWIYEGNVDGKDTVPYTVAPMNSVFGEAEDVEF